MQKPDAMSARTLFVTVAVAAALIFGGQPAGAARQAQQKKRADVTKPTKAVKSKAPTTSTLSRAKNELLSRYASKRGRDEGGRFFNLGFKEKVVRTKATATALANPSPVGKSKASIKVSPPRGKRAGRIAIDIPEFYAGATSLKARTKDVEIFGTDIRGDRVVIKGKLKIGAGSAGNAFRKATFEGEIPAGARMSRQQIEKAISKSQLHVNELTVKWSGAE